MMYRTGSDTVDEIEKSPEWRWCLAGNIAETHEYGEDHELMRGTKQFAPAEAAKEKEKYLGSDINDQ